MLASQSGGAKDGAITFRDVAASKLEPVAGTSEIIPKTDTATNHDAQGPSMPQFDPEKDIDRTKGNPYKLPDEGVVPLGTTIETKAAEISNQVPSPRLSGEIPIAKSGEVKPSTFKPDAGSLYPKRISAPGDHLVNPLKESMSSAILEELTTGELVHMSMRHKMTRKIKKQIESIVEEMQSRRFFERECLFIDFTYVRTLLSLLNHDELLVFDKIEDEIVDQSKLILRNGARSCSQRRASGGHLATSISHSASITRTD